MPYRVTIRVDYNVYIWHEPDMAKAEMQALDAVRDIWSADNIERDWSIVLQGETFWLNDDEVETIA